MVYGCPILPPTRNGSQVNYVMDEPAKAIKGYLQTVVLKDPSNTVPGWAVVIADSWYAAKKAAAAVTVEYSPGPTTKVSEKDIQDHAAKLIADPKKGSVLLAADTNTAAALKKAKSTLDATYTTATALHFQMEPLNALAFQKDGKWKSTPATSGRASSCPGSPRRLKCLKPTSSCAPTVSAAASAGASMATTRLAQPSPPEPSASP